MWRDWSRLRRFWYRGAIKTGLSRHEQNLTDCFQSFSVGYHSSLLHLSCIHEFRTFQLIYEIDDYVATTRRYR